MQLCNYKHDTIAYDGRYCPACDVYDKLDIELVHIEELKDEIKNLEILIDKQNG